MHLSCVSRCQVAIGTLLVPVPEVAKGKDHLGGHTYLPFATTYIHTTRATIQCSTCVHLSIQPVNIRTSTFSLYLHPSHARKLGISYLLPLFQIHKYCRPSNQHTIASTSWPQLPPLQSWSEHQIARPQSKPPVFIKPPPSTGITAATSSWPKSQKPARLTAATITSRGTPCQMFGSQQLDLNYEQKLESRSLRSPLNRAQLRSRSNAVRPFVSSHFLEIRSAFLPSGSWVILCYLLPVSIVLFLTLL
ncbi:uncharacterized protein F4807DRAFT_422086, partial [Annulohypoxylon truncatum]|uniref:uncharacterized protein n=1 Tax=Annulohypoxylon truncatum TaxID=327061 RepID=UPI002007351A